MASEPGLLDDVFPAPSDPKPPEPVEAPVRSSAKLISFVVAQLTLIGLVVGALLWITGAIGDVEAKVDGKLGTQAARAERLVERHAEQPHRDSITVAIFDRHEQGIGERLARIEKKLDRLIERRRRR